MDPMVEYYSQRASEYEEIYHRDDPPRQKELAQMAQQLRDACLQRSVLEVACGTGYWTEQIASAATDVTAVDASEGMLQLARQKLGAREGVRFVTGDAYNLDNVPGTFTTGVAMFWFSHVPRARVAEFLEEFHRKLDKGAVVFLADNVNVPGVGGELVNDPNGSDTFKLRQLKDGSHHRILKNYYAQSELRSLLEPYARSLETHFGAAYWYAKYELASSNHESLVEGR
jgi:ubiquinone/menaquinone biosynthesis C-methylase UbiE